METDPRIDELERRVGRLDAEVALLRRSFDSGTSTGATVQKGFAAGLPAGVANAWAPPPAPPAGGPPRAWPTPAASPRRGAPRLVLDSETVLKWGGVGLVVLAVGFAVSTAISRDWIGPELQLAGAILVGLGLIVAGFRLRTTRPGWTHALCSGGELALVTTVASDLFLDRATDPVAFVAMSLIVAGGLVMARVIRSEWVAVATVLGGAVGWAVIGDGDAAFLVMLIFYTVLVAGVLALGIEQRWFAARLVAHGVGMIALLALSFGAESATEQTLLAVVTVLLAGSFFVIPSIGDLSSVWQQLDVQLAAAAAPWAFTVTFVAILEHRGEHLIASVAFTIALAALAASVGLRARLRQPHVVSLLLGASVTVSIGLAVELSTSSVFVALAIQAAGLVVLSRAFGHNIRVLINAGVLAAIATVFVVVQTVAAWHDNAPWGDDIAHALIVVALAVAAWQVGERIVRRVGALAVLALTLVWSGSVLVHAPQGQAIVSVVWAALGTAVFVTGAVRRRADAAAAGLAVIGLTVGKLLTVDLREVDTLWRAGLFFLVGIGLLRLGFLLPRLTRAETTESVETAGAVRSDVDSFS